MDGSLIIHLIKFHYKGYYDLSNWIFRYKKAVFIDKTDSRDREITRKETEEAREESFEIEGVLKKWPMGFVTSG